MSDATTTATTTATPTAAGAVRDALVAHGLGPYFATPCGVLAPLLTALADHTEYHVVAREDNAVAMAAGVALAGRSPTVLMQNSGFGQCVNVLASLVVPYQIPLLLIVSMRGTPPDPTPENLAMGRLTRPILDGLAIGSAYLSPETADEQIAAARRTVRDERRSYALLVRPDAFDWKV
ncbi:sulfopyruvate decarboxylase subunit alpha [Streptacidiphilus sp. MAP12-33]|uniref:thiamine pyrophosphate-binding protein n=1 Tax=Streptacidiphilus sp. MAP12-33 TaxID=3156266 RepID=UPI003511BC17